MRTILIALLLSLATAVMAQDAPRPVFPDDYTPNPCAPEGTCQSYDRTQMRSAAFSMLAFNLDQRWVDAHWDQMLQLYAPICRKHGTCLATPGNNFLYCDDTIVPEYRAVCDRAFPKSTNAEDNTQCRMFTEIWVLGADMHGKKLSERGLACAKEKHLDVMHTKPPIVWIVPATIPRGYKSDIYIYAIDPDTHVPVQANVTLDKQLIYAPSNPAGNLATSYPFKWPIKYNRVKNAEGHEDVEAPLVTVKAEFYPPVTFRLPSTPGTMLVTMTPATLHPGVNHVTVTARDAETGKPVEARVMAGRDAVGETDQLIEITVPKGKKAPELWVTSLFDVYSDVVVK